MAENNLNRNAGITVADLIRQLQGHRQEEELYMGGLTFYRLKDRGGCIQMEFSQMHREGKDGEIIFYQP